uniref:Uncharacterized protein n=1 Tax=Arion vulgaris TaxID=1028688 RepID=A0A0B7AKH1_9EUPU
MRLGDPTLLTQNQKLFSAPQMGVGLTHNFVGSRYCSCVQSQLYSSMWTLL